MKKKKKEITLLKFLWHRKQMSQNIAFDQKVIYVIYREILRAKETFLRQNETSKMNEQRHVLDSDNA